MNNSLRLLMVGFLAVPLMMVLDGCGGRAGTSSGGTTDPKPMAIERVAPAPVKEVAPPAAEKEEQIPLRSVEMAARNPPVCRTFRFPTCCSTSINIAFAKTP